MTQSTQVSLRAPFSAKPFSLVGPSDDRGVIGQIERSGGTYEPGVMTVLRRVLRPDAVAFDVGANVGVFAVVMARLVPRGHVYAFEPAKETYDYLVRNLEANGTANFSAEQAAAFHESGSVQFMFSSAYPPGSFVGDSAEPGAEARTVPAVALDDYVASHHIDRVDLIMIDAEGAELSVLRGATATLANHQPALLIEINPALLQRFGGSSHTDLIAILRQHHELFAIDGQGAPARILSDRHLDLLLRREGVTDLLCLPQGRRRSLAAQRRGAHQLASLEAELGGPAAPAHTFVVVPAFAIAAPAQPVEASPHSVLHLIVPVHNTSAYWFSSDSQYYPVHVSYRWYDAAGTRLDVPASRAKFQPALAPGASQDVPLAVVVPDQPGEYQLSLTLLQENYAWFDDLDPALQLRLPGVVRVG